MRETAPLVPRNRRPLAALLAALAAGFGVAAAVVAFRDPVVPECVHLTPDAIGKRSFAAPPCRIIDENERYLATLETSMGTIRLIIDPRLAPDTVNNFVFLARAGFFDGTTFHRVENAPDHAIVQGGDPTGTGHGFPGYTYAGETPSPITRYIRGHVAMANTGDPSSNGSQFFIVVREWEALGPPGTIPNHTFFGIVADQGSMDALDRMVEVRVEGTKPVTDIVIRSVSVEQIPDDEPAPER